MSKNPRLIDITGHRFGRWLVITQNGNNKGGGALWMCRCDCGVTRSVLGADLRKGKSTNCGCLTVSRLGDLKRTHGGSRTRLYTTWKNMKARCYNPAGDSFEDYGARGIVVCDMWKDDFRTFREWALASGYRDDLTIERKDVNGNYEPDNCTWIEYGAQSFNRNYTMKDSDGQLWLHKARANGISNAAFRQRIAAGWSFEESSTWPQGKRRVRRERDDLGRFV